MRAYEQNLGYLGTGEAGALAVPAKRGWLARGLDAIALWHERTRSRRHLLAMSDTMLRDIGLDRGIAECEGGKRFWQN